MKTIERQKMPMTLRHIKANELPSSLLSKFNISPDDILTVTVEVESSGIKASKKEETSNFGDDMIESFENIIACEKGELDLPDMKDFLKTV